ncbi:MAG: DUF4384 domain-containing protein [Gammaproteobacteria bacterium]|nr:DUF4384 domain-containing protein [Gammaproteobacteria bacterium]
MNQQKLTTVTTSTARIVSIGLIAVILHACGANPQNVDLDLTKSLPEVKTTVFNQSIRQLGYANKIYGRAPLHVMSKPVFDKTGTSLPTQGEIPQDISEMVKSTLNGFGGDILYIPYDPDFMLNTAQTGYSQWGDKILPDVVLVGGLTEFDRGLVTKEEGTDISGSAEELGIPMGLDFADTRKESLARITLDFNLLDFQTFIGIPFMQAVNTINVHKGLGIDQLGFTVYGQTIGVRGNIKKIQGRHAAVRLLVQLSLIQVIGKYQNLPYWKLIPNSEPDSIVLDSIKEEFYEMAYADQVAKIQEYLFLYGKDVEVTGRVDSKTQSALSSIKGQYSVNTANPVSEKTYLALFENVPLNIKTQARRKQVNVMIENYQNSLRASALQEKPPVASVQQMPVVKAKPEQLATEMGEIKVWTSKQDFAIGDKMEVFFEVTQPMFVRIVTINSIGKMSTLFPNPYQNDNFVKPGKTVRIPPLGSPVNLTVGAPEGTDKIRVAASLTPITADMFPIGLNGEFKPEATSKYAVAGTDFNVVAETSNQAALEVEGGGYE